MRSSSIVPQKARAGSKAPPRHVQPGSRPCGRGAAATVGKDGSGPEREESRSDPERRDAVADSGGGGAAGRPHKRGESVGGAAVAGAAASRKQGTGAEGGRRLGRQYISQARDEYWGGGGGGGVWGGCLEKEGDQLRESAVYIP